MATMTAEKKIERANVRLMGHKATMAYSSILMIGSTTIDDHFPTACTNGRDKIYGRAFVDGLSDAQINGLILHEANHVKYQHGYIWKHLCKENKQLANMAMDYVINLEIYDLHKEHPSFIELPEGALLDEQYRGMDTQQVFEKLKQQGGGGEGEGDGTSGFDVHDFDSLTDEQKKDLSGQIEQAIRQGALMAGKMGGDVDRSFENLMEPKVNWKDQLREFVSATTTGKDDSTWRRPNRRCLQHDMYMPSTISETMGNLVVVIDTSGSIDAELASSFLSEVKGICDNVSPEQIHLLCCDAVVQSHELFSREDYGALLNKRTFRGGGGTDMRVALDYVYEKQLNPELILVLTDGYTAFPTELRCPTLWGITDRSISSPVGTSVYIG